MKLIFNNCSAEILDNSINLKEGIAMCHQCSEVFKIADHLKHTDEELRRLPKPVYTKVEIEKRGNSTSIIVPSAGWNGSTIFLLIFNIFWNGAVIFTIVGTDKWQWSLIHFPVIGLFMFFLFVFNLKGKLVLTIDRHKLKARWSAMGLSWTKTRDTQFIDKITEDVMYKQNYQPVYGIGIFCTGQSKVKFGSSLREDERKWLIGELYEIKDIYQQSSF